jgi:hypothetical protein
MLGLSEELADRARVMLVPRPRQMLVRAGDAVSRCGFRRCFTMVMPVAAGRLMLMRAAIRNWGCAAGHAMTRGVKIGTGVFEQIMPALPTGHQQAKGGKQQQSGQSVDGRAHTNGRENRLSGSNRPVAGFLFHRSYDESQAAAGCFLQICCTCATTANSRQTRRISPSDILSRTPARFGRITRVSECLRHRMRLRSGGEHGRTFGDCGRIGRGSQRFPVRTEGALHDSPGQSEQRPGFRFDSTVAR